MQPLCLASQGELVLSPQIEWLPEFISVDGVWDEILNILYSVFSKDFKNEKLFHGGLEVWYDRSIKEGQFEEGFWHIIAREDIKTKERLFDPRRAERLPWCAPIIRNFDDFNIKWWRYREGNGKIRRYLWLCEWDYVVILEERMLYAKNNMPSRATVFLITAFYIDGNQKRADLERKFAAKEV
jgi:hypothetical protein